MNTDVYANVVEEKQWKTIKSRKKQPNIALFSHP